MNRRCEPRIEVSRPVAVTVLGGAEPPFPGHVLNVSGKGMRMLLYRALPTGTLLEVKWEGSLLLGEVCYCHRLPEENQFAIGLQIEHALSNAIEVARLARRLLGVEYEPASR